MEIEDSSLVYLPADCRKILDSRQSRRVECSRGRGQGRGWGRGQVSTRERQGHRGRRLARGQGPRGRANSRWWSLCLLSRIRNFQSLQFV